MKKFMFVTLVICFLFAGCGNVKAVTELTEPISTAVGTEQAASASKIYPLPNTTMDNLSDTILSISLEEGDETGTI